MSNRGLVRLNVYDLAEQNAYLYWAGVGIFHSGVEVYGVEFAYGKSPGPPPPRHLRQSFLTTPYDHISRAMQAVTSTMRVVCSPPTHEMLLDQVGTDRARAQYCCGLASSAVAPLLMALHLMPISSTTARRRTSAPLSFSCRA